MEMSAKSHRKPGVLRTTAEAIEVFQSLHGERFEYTHFVYQGNNARADFICREHGKYESSFELHKRADGGCGQCILARRTQAFIARVHRHYGNDIDFSLMEYQSSEIPVTLICRHGPFTVYPSNVKQNGGCRLCIGEALSRKHADNIRGRFADVHGNRYDYSKFIYKHMHMKSEIICRLHGLFEMSPANHLSDHGCWRCVQTQSSREENKWIGSIAKELGVIPDRHFVPPTRSRAKPAVDAVFGSVAVEYDGSYWHSRPASYEKDRAKTRSILSVLPVVIRLRVQSRQHGLLPDIPGAINIHIRSKISANDVLTIAEQIRKAQCS